MDTDALKKNAALEKFFLYDRGVKEVAEENG